MSANTQEITRRQVRSPHSAAVAGIIFSLLTTISPWEIGAGLAYTTRGTRARISLVTS
jgi:hypothetical protein